MLAPYCKWQDQRLCIKMEVMQCDICQGGLESIYLQKKESSELENERPRWSILLLEGEYKFRGWMWEMSRGVGEGLDCTNFPECRQTTSHIRSCILLESHTQNTGPLTQLQSPFVFLLPLLWL